MAFDQTSRRKTYALTFRPYPGLTVWCRKPGFAALEDLTAAVLALGDEFDGERMSGEERVRWWGVLFRALERSVSDWNLTDGGRTVPVAGLLDQDHEFLLALARTWYAIVVLHRETAPAAPEAEEPEQDDAAKREARLADIPVRVVDDDEPVSA